MVGLRHRSVPISFHYCAHLLLLLPFPLLSVISYEPEPSERAFEVIVRDKPLTRGGRLTKLTVTSGGGTFGTCRSWVWRGGPDANSVERGDIRECYSRLDNRPPAGR